MNSNRAKIFGKKTLQDGNKSVRKVLQQRKVVACVLVLVVSHYYDQIRKKNFLFWGETGSGSKFNGVADILPQYQSQNFLQFFLLFSYNLFHIWKTNKKKRDQYYHTLSVQCFLQSEKKMKNEDSVAVAATCFTNESDSAERINLLQKTTKIKKNEICS